MPETPSRAASSSSTGSPASIPREARRHGRARPRMRRVRTRSVRDAGRGGEHPQRREAERRDRPELDYVACPLPSRRACPGRARARPRPGHGPRPADELDRDAEEVPRRRLVEPRLPDEPRQRELERLLERPAERRGDGAHDPFGQGSQEGWCGPRSLASSSMATDRLRTLLEQAFPGGSVAVLDRIGGGDHFHVTVESAAFDGLTSWSTAW